MKIKDIITENGPDLRHKLPQDQVDAIKGARTNHDLSINKSDGSAYMQYRHGLALACAGSGKTPDEPMPAEGAFSGDPVFSSYVDEENEMLDRAAKTVGAGPSKKLSDNKSKESNETHKHSPVPHNSGVRGRQAE